MFKGSGKKKKADDVQVTMDPERFEKLMAEADQWAESRFGVAAERAVDDGLCLHGRQKAQCKDCRKSGGMRACSRARNTTRHGTARHGTALTTGHGSVRHGAHAPHRTAPHRTAPHRRCRRAGIRRRGQSHIRHAIGRTMKHARFDAPSQHISYGDILVMATC